jgi:peptide/nickel transport system permease protein
MLKFALRRLVVLPLIIWFTNFLAFAYAHLVTPNLALLNPYSFGSVTFPPLLPAYLAYLQRLARLDFGVMPNNEPFWSAFNRAGVASFGLLGLALFFSVIVGLLLGLRAVRLNPPRVSSWLTILASVGLASPAFYIGVLLIAFSVIYVIWGPGSEPLFPFQGFGWDAHLVLPVLALMVQPTVKVAQITAGSMVGELGKQYVVAARSFGHPLSSIRGRLVLRNVLAPVTLTIAGSLRLLAAEIIMIERLFNWPGLGRMFSHMIVASSQADYYFSADIFAMTLTLLAIFFLLADLTASLIVRGFDPRVEAA